MALIRLRGDDLRLVQIEFYIYMEINTVSNFSSHWYVFCATFFYGVKFVPLWVTLLDIVEVVWSISRRPNTTIGACYFACPLCERGDIMVCHI